MCVSDSRREIDREIKIEKKTKTESDIQSRVSVKFDNIII